VSFRRRITLVSAVAVAIAVVLASALTYLLTSNQLHSQIDAQLRERAKGLRLAATPGTSSGRSALPALGTPAFKRLLEHRATRNPFGRFPPRPDQVRGYQQLVEASGRVIFRSPQAALPVDARTRALAARGGHAFFSDTRSGGLRLRVLAEPVRPGLAVQFAQPLTDVDRLLSRLRLILALLDVGGIALAALLGRLVAGAAVLPVKRLTQATEHVTQTRDLTGRIEPIGEDEIGRLATSFNAMLDALEHTMRALDASVHAQRQLVADASHELRTPITSLRTNIEIMQGNDDLEPIERERLLTGVLEQIEELTALMNDLIDLARGEEPAPAEDDVRLDLIVRETVERTRRRAPDTPFHLQLAPLVLTGDPARVSRAVKNLVDNAVKYSPAAQPVEIRLSGDELTVRDHGPGIAPEDLPHIFDRFYRGADARSRPGSGLGLAIVRQVVQQLGGSVDAEAAVGGGTLLRVRLPSMDAVEQPAETADGHTTAVPYSPV
jgi:two-component system sensor histidine kinase MprB